EASVEGPPERAAPLAFAAVPHASSRHPHPVRDEGRSLRRSPKTPSRAIGSERRSAFACPHGEGELMSSVPSLEDVLERGRRDRSLDECLAGLAEVLNTELPVHRLVAGLIHPDRERLVLVGVWTSGPTQIRLGAVVRPEATAF